MKVLAPLAVFGAVLAAMVALHGSATAPPALSAGVMYVRSPSALFAIGTRR